MSAPKIDGRTQVVRQAVAKERSEKRAAPLVVTSPRRLAQLGRLRSQYLGVSTETQQALLLRALESGPITTIEASEHLDMRHPAGRKKGLQDSGHNILTRWVKQATMQGTLHTVGQYALIRATE